MHWPYKSDPKRPCYPEHTKDPLLVPDTTHPQRSHRSHGDIIESYPNGPETPWWHKGNTNPRWLMVLMVMAAWYITVEALHIVMLHRVMFIICIVDCIMIKVPFGHCYITTQLGSIRLTKILIFTQAL